MVSGSRNALNDVDVRVSDVELRRYGTGGQYFMFVTCFAVKMTERAVVNISAGVARLRIAGYGQGREAEATTTKMVRNQSSGLGTLVLQGDHRITAPEDGSECTWVNKGLGGKARHPPWWQVFVLFIGTSLQRPLVERQGTFEHSVHVNHN